MPHEITVDTQHLSQVINRLKGGCRNQFDSADQMVNLIQNNSALFSFSRPHGVSAPADWWVLFNHGNEYWAIDRLGQVSKLGVCGLYWYHNAHVHYLKALGLLPTPSSSVVASKPTQHAPAKPIGRRR